MQKVNDRKKILIIGSKGFIGHHTLAHFRRLGDEYETWGCDVMVDYVQKNYLLLDTTNADFKSIFNQQSFDYCINCSGAADVSDSFVHPWRDFQLNTVNVYKILDAIRLHNPKCRFLNLSSAAVYGNPTVLPISAKSLLGPLSPYGEHKQMAEQVCQEFYSLFGVATCSLRIFSAYGEGLRKQLFWDLHRKASESNASESVEILGTGDESRDFIYILDLVRCIEIIMIHGTFTAEAINVGNGEEISIRKAVDTFYSLYPEKIRYHFSGEQRIGYPTNWCADVSEIRKMGYKPRFTLLDGLNNYSEWAQIQKLG